MLNIESINDLHWYPNGQVSLSGSLLELQARIDRLFLAWSEALSAVQFGFPATLPMSQMAKTGYLKSFPHLANFPVFMDERDENIGKFLESEEESGDGRVPTHRLAAPRDILNPAACYHVYLLNQGRDLDGPVAFTCMCSCFRRETHYLPLRRQWNFTMREIVFLGTGPEVNASIEAARGHLERFLSSAGLPIEFISASDPFYIGHGEAKRIVQKISNSKIEMVYGGDLAIGSMNRHRDFFGKRLGIRRASKPAHSACIAFGIERWIYACLDRFGPREEDWPF